MVISIGREDLTVHVNQRQVGTRVDHTLANDQTQAAGAAGDDADVAVEGECAEGRLDVLAGDAADGLAAGQLVLGGVLDLDVLVGSRVAAGLVAAGRDVVQEALGRHKGRSDDRGLGCEGRTAGGLSEHGSECRHCDCVCMCVECVG